MGRRADSAWAGGGRDSYEACQFKVIFSIDKKTNEHIEQQVNNISVKIENISQLIFVCYPGHSPDQSHLHSLMR